MADTATVEQENGTVTETTQEARTFTQAELDEIVKARIAKERAKYADFETLQQKASKFDEMEEANKSELQKATEKADSLQKQLDEMIKANNVREIRDKISSELGVPASLLTADTEEACKAQAEAIMNFAKPNSYPSVRDAGEIPAHSSQKSTREQFADFVNSSINNY